MTDHRIQRITLELRASDADLARPLLDRASRLLDARIAPLLDRLCDAHSGPDRLDRIDRLELDLGVLPDDVDAFADALLRALGPALDAALRAACTARPDAPDAAARELLTCFARTGALPWFADRRTRDPVAVALTTALATPHDLLALFHTLADDRAALARLARHMDTPHLLTLVRHRFPPDEHTQAIHHALEHPRPAPDLRRHLLTTLVAPGATSALVRALVEDPAPALLDPWSAALQPPGEQPLSEHSPPPASSEQSIDNSLLPPFDAASSRRTIDFQPPPHPHAVPSKPSTTAPLEVPQTRAPSSPPRQPPHAALHPSAPHHSTLLVPARPPVNAAHIPAPPRALPSPGEFPHPPTATESRHLSASTAHIRRPDPPPQKSLTAEPPPPAAERPDPPRLADTNESPSPPHDLSPPVESRHTPPRTPSPSPLAGPRAAPATFDLPHLAGTTDTPAPLDPLPGLTESSSPPATSTRPHLIGTTPVTRDDLSRPAAPIRHPAIPGGLSPHGESHRHPATFDDLGGPHDAPATPGDLPPRAESPCLSASTGHIHGTDPPPSFTAESATPAAEHPDLGRLADASESPIRSLTAITVDPTRPLAPPSIPEQPSTRLPDPRTAVPRRRPHDPHESLRRRVLAQQDQLPVDDAGLVLLWPFLLRFFQRLALLDDRREFLDDRARITATVLLEHLATGDPEPPEYHLPLAKLLCGSPVVAPCALDHPLPDESQAEATHLLAAVVDHVPVLRHLSVLDLRAAFLVRPGVLSTRDGTWLLRVERRTHDVLLPQFPWTWEWIKLPWMPDPLQVEW